MKKLSWLLILVIVLSSPPVYGADNEIPVIAKYTSSFTREQGVNNWYFCEFKSSEINELVFTDGYWKSPTDTFPSWSENGGAMTPGNTVDVGLKFIAPMRGMIRLKGTVNMPVADSVKGNGVTAKLYKGQQLLWSQKIGYGSPGNYDITTSIRTADELYFRVCADNANPFDWTIWWPTVEYLGIEYVAEEGEGTFYQKKDGEVKKLEYNEEKNGYLADDGIAFVNHRSVMPSEEYSLVRR